ncbi:uncharacterized protein [Anabrus simplex]|uniref:uncharacterized protein n=1 Tax=Anabrus simplex TaxID=316456 RepID=UPI0034DD383C
MADSYDEDFQHYLILARSLIKQLHDKEDRKICAKWISKLCSLRSDDINVKKNRNAFFKYFLHIIRDGVLENPFLEEPPEGSLPNCSRICSEAGLTQRGAMQWLQQEVLKQNSMPHYMSHWSPDRRTYVAAKPIPGRGALVYMAVTRDPDQGWDIPGKRKPKSY